MNWIKSLSLKYFIAVLALTAICAAVNHSLQTPEKASPWFGAPSSVALPSSESQGGL